MTDHQVSAGQIYEACHPLDERRLIRIVAVQDTRATIVTCGGSNHWRQLLLSSLHPTGTTRHGTVRRTGYRLVHPQEGSSP